jgi:hypothetical protein
MTKIIYVMVHGEAEAGKSEFIRAISEIDIRPRAGGIEDMSAADFGRLWIEAGKFLLYLFANRGGKLFPDIENHLNEEQRKHMVYCVLVNPSKIFDEKRNNYEKTKLIIEETGRRKRPFLIVANTRKNVESYTIGELCEMLHVPETIRFLECDPVSEPKSAKRIIVELLKMLPQDELVQAAIAKLEADIF